MSPNRSTGEWSLAVRQQAAVARLGQLGLRGGDLQDLLEAALLSIAEELGARNVALLELLPSWRELAGRAAVHDGAVVDVRLVDRVRIPAGRESMAGFTVMQGVAVVSGDIEADERFQVRAPDYGIPARAAVTAPVGWGERPWGVVVVYSDVVRAWTDDDVHFVQSMANTVGLAVARQRVEHELRDSSARLELSLGAGGFGAWTWDVRTDSVELSPSALAIYGLVGEAFDGDGDAFLELIHPDDRAALRGETYEALQTSGEQHNVYRTVRPDGEVRWVESWGRVLRGNDQPYRLVGVIADITDRQRAEESREALLVAEQHARERLTLLAEATARFSGSLDPDVIVATLPEFCVPRLADVCMVDLFDEVEQLREVAADAVDPERLADVRALRRKRAELGGVGGVWSERRVAGRAESVFEPVMTDEQFQAAASDEDHLALFRRFHARSSMVVPLVARDRVIGVLTLIITEPGRQYEPDHLTLVEELAGRAALALDNGRLFASRNRVARSLQAALLPPALPRIDGLGLAARYRVAEADIEIGGDFYDVIEVGGGAWGVVVGDVCGRGPDAAALTGLMRHSVRTAVVREAAPSRVLAQTNDAVLDQIDDARFCTAAYLRLEPEGPGRPVRVVASSAGHPRPVVLRADGRAELVDCSGLLLGVVPSPSLVDVEVTLEPGDSVVLYTDGVTEARRGKELFGEKRLLAAIRSLAGQDAEGIAAGLDDAVSDYQDDANDDIAIVVVQAQRA
ncbi:SpoIIE family protein phosphatase [Aquihabitans sp. G128]|uniref:SpoIIE family protein phosphatase n=1 Tax=Aquihabitans sp. G128 TaxID=2849779 RepID=UPI001C238F5D|nr:SpoIIE family protein phosphatase [Aquihabitans sp. G128]QXC61511.1 SpoIIE family protein phosphatase [Aquihabitans sp. G128]